MPMRTHLTDPVVYELKEWKQDRPGNALLDVWTKCKRTAVLLIVE
jgi:hypothetical protein